MDYLRQECPKKKCSKSKQAPQAITKPRNKLMLCACYEERIEGTTEIGQLITGIKSDIGIRMMVDGVTMKKFILSLHERSCGQKLV
ncbi:hypothetical protein EVAR_79838_1 [Eumeta japonica]|uniref:Uncharacterized protein n=1 Tax=Eumeta variegata TaxID=151549 RepID=A0A4C1TYV7_EUMVA|nr:hypothetical protein EVAR_79838_1 [Eumeta japonica]